MDTDELIKEFLAKHVDQVAEKLQEMQSYTDHFTKKKVWYDNKEMWELLGGHNDPSMDTKLPFKPDSIP